MNNFKWTMLNKIQKTIILVIGSIVILIVYLLFSKISGTGSTIFTNTIPVIPTGFDRSVNDQVTLNTVKVLNPEQKIVFNWNSITPTIPGSMAVYSVKNPLINNAITASLIRQLGFTSQDKRTEDPDGDLQIISKTGSLFISKKLNQISYSSKITIPVHSQNISKSDAIIKAKSLISSLFGESIVSTLDNNPEVRYLLLQPTDVEKEPSETSVEKANLIVVSFKQTVKNFPIVAQSRNGETLTIAIDTKNNLFSMSVTGGYYEISQLKQFTLVNFTDLQRIAPTSSLRISWSKDIGSERAFTDAKLVNVSVNSVELGYFQIGNRTLSPVFIISGIMSAKGLEEYPATYIVPATKN